MKLHAVVGSPNCRKVQAALNHLGLAIDIAYLDFFAGDLQSPAYLRINPNGFVPSLEDGGFVLWESNAIMQYLADGVAGQDLYPTDRRRRADVNRWLAWELAHFNKSFGVLAFEAVAKPAFLKQAPDPAKVAWSVAELARFAPVLDAALQGRDYLVGDAITLADYAVIHLEAFKDAVPFDWKPYANCNAYFDRMKAVPHWAGTAAPSPEAVGRRPAGH